MFLGFIVTLIKGEFFKTLMTIPFVLMGIYFLYASVLILMNKTIITVNKKEIIVRNKFKFASANVFIGSIYGNESIFDTNESTLKVSELENIFSKVKKEIIKTKNKERLIYHYQVNAQTSNGTDKQIIETNNREQMLFIEKTLKDYLNIKDELQEGEVN